MTINLLGYLIENLIFLRYFWNKKLFTKLSSNDDECLWKGVGNQSTSQTFQGQNYFYLSSSNPLSNPGNLSISSKLILKNESTFIFLQSSLHKILPRDLPFFIFFLGCWKGIHKSSQKDYICKDNMSLMNNIFWTIILLKKYTQISEFHVITISSRYLNPCSIMVDLSVGIINLLCWKDFLSQQDINQILNFADVTKSTLAISRKPSFKLLTIS